MEKINFEEGTQVSPAKVMIDNIEHEVTPAVWKGNTPLSPFVLNKLQDNIENAIENKRLKLEGKSEQDGTPSPNNIISIRNIGDNINEFSSELELGEISNDTGINSINTNSIRTKDYIKVKPNTTYTIKNSNNYMNVIYFYKKDKTYINYSYSTETSYTFTTGPTAEYIRVRSSSTKKENDLTTKYVLVEGQIVANYNEYGCGSIDYLARNKNLGYVEYYNKIRAYKNGNLIDNNSYNTYKAIVEGNTQYTISFEGTENSVSNLCYFDKSMNYIKGEPFNNGNPRRLTTPENCQCITLAVNHDITNFMIEKGNTKTEYIEHKEQNIHFPLSEGQLLHEGDYLASDGIHKKRETLVLDGTENWVLSTTYENTFYCNKPANLLKNSMKYSNITTNFERTLSTVSDGISIGLYLNVKNPNISTLEEFINEVKNNNIVIEYELAEEVITPLTKEQIEAFYELQKSKYVNKMELTCLNEIEPTLTDIDKSLEESLLNVEKLLAMVNS